MAKGALEGTRIVVLAGVLAVAVLVGVLVGFGMDAEGWRTAARATARTSFVAFLPVFVASSINGLFGGSIGKWLLRNRRFLGLGFATCHLVHAVTFMTYSAMREQSITELVSSGTLYGGGAGYVLVGAMAVTSTNAAVKRMGRRNWTILHRTGMYALAGIFVVTYLGRGLAGEPLGVAAMLALVAGFGLRLAARIRLMHRRR